MDRRTHPSREDGVPGEMSRVDETLLTQEMRFGLDPDVGTNPNERAGFLESHPISSSLFPRNSYCSWPMMVLAFCPRWRVSMTVDLREGRQQATTQVAVVNPLFPL